eukprot:1190856-Prorocentrum_minimum.AAC.2
MRGPGMLAGAVSASSMVRGVRDSSSDHFRLPAAAIFRNPSPPVPVIPTSRICSFPPCDWLPSTAIFRSPRSFHYRVEYLEGSGTRDVSMVGSLEARSEGDLSIKLRRP